MKHGRSGIAYNEPSSILTLVGLGVAAGYGGGHALSIVWKRLRKQLEEKEKEIKLKGETIDELTLIADAGRYLDVDSAKAEVLYMRTLEQHPESFRACAGIAAVRKRQGKLNEAIVWCSRALEKNPDYAVAYYNRSCYKCLSGAQLSDVLFDLQKAIQLDSTYREAAQLDPDFNSIAKRPEFLRLVKTQ